MGRRVELVNADPVMVGKEPLVYQAERGYGGLVLGIRGDGDVLGRGIAPALTGEYSTRYFGGSLSIIILNAIPGVRLEGRFFPVEVGRARPYVAAGSTAFVTGASIRGAIGCALRIQQIRLWADVAFEQYFGGDERRYAPRALLLGLGAGWQL